MTTFRSACVVVLAALLLASCDQLKQKAGGVASGGAAQGSGAASGSNAQTPLQGDSVPGCPLAGFSLPPGAGYTVASDNPDNWMILLAPDVDYNALLKHVDATLGIQGWHTEGAKDFGNGRLAIYTSGSDSHSIGVQYFAEPDAVPYSAVNITNTTP